MNVFRAFVFFPFDAKASRVGDSFIAQTYLNNMC